MKPDIHGAQIIGQREQQEDRFDHATMRRLFTANHLLILADGMGGHARGDVAADLAVSNFASTYRKSASAIRDSHRQALDAANDAINAQVARTPELEGMGTTLIAATIAKDALSWVSVGDSHLYRISGGTLTKLNADHSMAPVLAKMVERGELTAEQAAGDPSRHALRSALDGGKIDLVDFGAMEEPLAPKDILILASDGLDSLTPDEVLEIATRSRRLSAKTIAAALLRAVEAKALEHQDNTSLIVFIQR